ncbi:MAG TPA: hypothetical protein VEG60_31590 [Candidatus Binatia bacterium]|nr:hypothetical protein [Candidatus Binatia bacterium]
MLYEIHYRQKSDSDRVATRITHLESDANPTWEEIHKVLRKRFGNDVEYVDSKAYQEPDGS